MHAMYRTKGKPMFTPPAIEVQPADCQSGMPRALLALMASACALLAGCAGLSGLDSTSSFQCSAPAGIPCQSVTGVHLNERAGNLPSQRPKARPPKSGAPAEEHSGEGYPTATAATTVATAGAIPPASGSRSDAPAALTAPTPAALSNVVSLEPRPTLGAIRSDPTVIRIWVAPWEDADGDLHDQGYVYLQIDSGRWLIEHNRERIRREFTPTQPALAARAPGRSPPVAPNLTGQATAPNAGGETVRTEPSQDLLAAIAEGRRRAQLGSGGQGVAGSRSEPGAQP